AFLVTVDVPEIYMQEFWATTTVHHHSIRFKMDNKKHIVNLESFRDMLHICPRVPGQSFVEPSFEEEILASIHFLRHSAVIMKLTDVNINKLYQPWRSFVAIINKCLTEKSSGYNSLRLSQAQILWGLYHKRNVDYAYLMWKDFVYQVEHKDSKKSNVMYYPQFTKVIIHHFMLKDPSIPRKNKVNWHYVRDDHVFFIIKLVSRHQNIQQFGALLPIELTNEEIRNSNAYKEYYAVATGATPPKPKASTHISQASGFGTDEETGSILGVLDVPSDESEEELSWKSTDKQSDDDEGKDGDGDEEDEGDDGEEGDGDDDDKDDAGGEDDDDDDDDHEVERDVEKDDEEKGGDDEQEYDEEEYDEETRDEESFDPISKTPENSNDEGNGEEDLGLNVGREEGHDEDEEEDKLYRDVNISQGRGIQATLEVEDSHVTLTPVNPDGHQQSSSVSSLFVTSMLNLTLNVGMESIFETTSQMDAQTPTLVAPFPMSAPTITPSTIATITTTSQAPLPPTTAPSTLIQDLPNFGSLFGFDNILRTLEANFSEFMQTNYSSSKTSYAVVANLSEMELKKILIEKIKGNKSIQRSNEQRNLYKALVEAYESDKIILDTYRETVTLKRRRDDDADKDEEPSTGPDRGSKRRREGKEPESASAPKEKATRSAGKSTQRTKSQQVSASESAIAEEPMQTTFQMEEPSHPESDIGAEDLPIIQSSQHPEWFSQQQKSPTLDHDWNTTLPTTYGSIQPWISELAKQSDSRSSFNELMDTPLDFSIFLINRLKVDTLTPELIAGPTYELLNGSYKSLVELEYHLEEVYKATTDQLDWVNPEGQQYPHNLLKPLPLIPNSQGRRVILFEHFINNDLEYLREDLVPRTMWIKEPIGYDKHALWGVSYWRHKRQQFYDFAVNWESARNAYSKQRIIAVTELKIVEWHNYKYLDWITV
nr:hypothetical protein [Tanacetum cinerariifolium]